jgi:hypothetical protein
MKMSGLLIVLATAGFAQGTGTSFEVASLRTSDAFTNGRLLWAWLDGFATL